MAAKHLEEFRQGLHKTSQLFDLKKLAAYVALCDFFQGQHALTDSNIILYFNPTTFLFEPISFESNSIDPIFDLAITISRSEDPPIILKRIFEDNAFIEHYVDFLIKFSKKEYLDNFLIETNNELKEKLNILNTEYYLFTANIDILYQNQEFIRANINPVKGIHAFFKEKNNNSLILDIGSIQPFPIEINSLLIDDMEVKTNDIVIIPGLKKIGFASYQQVNFEIPEDFISTEKITKKLKIKYKILGNDKIFQDEVIEKSYITDSQQ